MYAIEVSLLVYNIIIFGSRTNQNLKPRDFHNFQQNFLNLYIQNLFDDPPDQNTFR